MARGGCLAPAFRPDGAHWAGNARGPIRLSLWLRIREIQTYELARAARTGRSEPYRGLVPEPRRISTARFSGRLQNGGSIPVQLPSRVAQLPVLCVVNARRECRNKVRAAGASLVL